VRGVVVCMLLAGVAVATEREGRACTCEVLSPIVSPREGASDVPRNAVVIATFQYANQPVLELVDVTTGQPVDLGWTVHPSDRIGSFTVFARPAQLLAAGATYEILAAPQADYREWRWRFTVGDSIDTTPPSFAGLRGAAFETMRYGSGCTSSCIAARDGYVSRIRLDYDGAPSDAAYLELELRTLDGQSLARMPVPGVEVLGSHICEPRSPVLEPGTWYCARMIAYDVAGQPAGGTELFCGEAVSCAPALKEVGIFCEPSDLCEEAESPPPGLAPSAGCATGTDPRTPWLFALLGAAIAVVHRRSRRRCR
jgi:MYXO-CTERM domain-containing protein